MLKPALTAMSASRPTRVSSAFIRSAQADRDTVHSLLSSMSVQLESSRIASANVDSAVLSITDAFEAFSTSARRELEKQAILLRALPPDLDMISRIGIHSEFLSPAVRRAVETGDRPRTLGDFVSKNKMSQVGEQCSQVHGVFGKEYSPSSKLTKGSEELKKRFTEAELSLTTIASDADSVRKAINDFM